MEFIFDREARIIVCRFSEKMDTPKSNEAAAVFRENTAEIAKDLVPPGPKIVFDMEGVVYIASAFLRLCLSAAKGAGEANFSIRNTGPEIMKVFKIAGLDSVLNVE